jgi:hypothetical protein
MRQLILFCLAAVIAGCDPAALEDAAEGSDEVVVPIAAQPAWSGDSLSADQVPSVYLEVWNRAENRDSCALIAPLALGEGTGATPRAATFSGGWAVAYDRPDLRSAFGVAGAGVSASGPTYTGWPNSRDWADGSNVGYGPEGGTGPNQLAFLQIQGQGCLYNIWSRLSVQHLEYLLDQLHFVRVTPAA